MSTYNAAAVNDAIASSNRAGRRIGGKQACMVHAVLKGHTAPAKKTWRVIQGTSRATIRATDYSAAKSRAAYIGFDSPDSIVLID